MSCLIKSVAETDRIRCDFVVRAPRQKVWAALTTREGWSGWFSEDVESDFQVGSKMRLDFGTYGECWGLVSERREEEVFAYRWHPGEDCAFEKYPTEEMTTVRFEIHDAENGTRIVMTESGFSNLPESRRANALGMNTKGWEDELEEMRTWLEEDKKQLSNAKSIKRERIYKTTQEKLWNAVATADGLSGWFCKSVKGVFSPGEFVILTFDFGTPFEGPLKVVEYEPTHTFAFRWHPGQENGCRWSDFPEDQATLVTITLAPAENGVFLSILETGFENVREEFRFTSLELNRQGWTSVMDMIGDYLTAR